MGEITVWRAAAGCLSAADERASVRELRAGGVLVVPTETVYGLAADCWNAAAIDRLVRLKGRPEGKGLAVQVAEIDQLRELLPAPLPPVARWLLDRFSPGPLTLVLQGDSRLPAPIRGPEDSIAIRIPGHPVMLSLLRQSGIPLAVTSANRSGEPPAVTADEAIRIFGHEVNGVLNAGPSSLGIASTVVDVRTGRPSVIREGAISAEVIMAAIEEGIRLDYAVAACRSDRADN